MTMVEYYPAFLDVRGWECVVVGGGQVAQRKARALLEAGARVKVISPSLAPSLQRLARAGKLEVLPRPYEPGDLKGARLAIAAADDPRVNGAVAEEARERGILVNVVDDPARCNFIAPSIVRRGDLVLAISTGGKSPALARHLREALEALFPPEYGDFLEFLARVRQEMRQRGERISPQRWQRGLTPEVLGLVRQGAWDQAREALLSNLLPAGKRSFSAEAPPPQKGGVNLLKKSLGTFSAKASLGVGASPEGGR